MTSLMEIVQEVGGSLLHDNNSHFNRFNIQSESSDRLYIVSQAKSSGEWQCSCPGWIYKKPGKERSCKHLNAMLPALQLISGPAAPKSKLALAQPKAALAAAKKPAKPKAATTAKKPKAALPDVKTTSAKKAKKSANTVLAETAVARLTSANGKQVTLFFQSEADAEMFQKYASKALSMSFS